MRKKEREGMVKRRKGKGEREGKLVQEGVEELKSLGECDKERREGAKKDESGVPERRESK